jgi:hypothetical protein
MAVDVYDDGSVTMYEDGHIYDGNTDNLIAFCKESDAKVVSDTIPVPLTPHSEELKGYKAEAETLSSDLGDSASESTDAFVIAETPPIKEVVPARVPNLVKEKELLAHGNVLPDIARAPTTGVSLQKRMLFSDQTNMVFHELVRASLEGRKPNKGWIDKIMEVRGPAEPAPDIGPSRPVKRGGTLKDLFEKFRNVPDEELFTSNVESLFLSQEEFKLEMDAADYRHIQILRGSPDSSGNH